MMDVVIVMSVHVPTHVDRVQFVRILKVVIAATAQKDSTEMPDLPAVSTTTNVLVHLVDETLTAPMKLERSSARALTASEVIP